MPGNRIACLRQRLTFAGAAIANVASGLMHATIATVTHVVLARGLVAIS